MLVPERRKTKCEFCGDDLDIDGDGVHQYTKGWVKHRDGGGGHGISLRETESRWVHGYCLDQKKRGLIDQKSMF